MIKFSRIILSVSDVCCDEKGFWWIITHKTLKKRWNQHSWIFTYPHHLSTWHGEERLENSRSHFNPISHLFTLRRWWKILKEINLDKWRNKINDFRTRKCRALFALLIGTQVKRRESFYFVVLCVEKVEKAWLSSSKSAKLPD